MKKFFRDYLLLTSFVWIIYLLPISIWGIVGLNYTPEQSIKLIWQSIPFDALTNYPLGLLILRFCKKVNIQV